MIDIGRNPRKGDIIERLHTPGERCLVTGRIGDFVEFTVLQGPDQGRERIIAARAVRVLIPAP